MADDDNNNASERTQVESSSAKSDDIKQRLRLLKQKMNQARQLNQQAVRDESERLNGARPKQPKAEKSTHMTQSAGRAMSEARRKTETQAAIQYETTDYHNSQGQFRNYELSLKGLPKQQSTATDTFNPLEAASTVDTDREREGSRHLAETMQRKYAKKLEKDRKRKGKEDSGEVSYINKRNKHFNEKISRNYKAATAEIRQNLERGTAL